MEKIVFVERNVTSELGALATLRHGTPYPRGLFAKMSRRLAQPSPPSADAPCGLDDRYVFS